MVSNVDTLVCPDWIWLNNSNVHVAKDRGWFTTYTSFASEIKSSIFCSPTPVPVLGVGTVEIPTKRSPNKSGVSSHGSLCLKQVLHVPGFICNVIGGFAEDFRVYNVDTCGNLKSQGTIRDQRGRSIAYFDPKRPLCSIKVRNRPEGPRLGPHALQKDGKYMLSCAWDHIEQQRWLDHQVQMGYNSRGLEPARANNTNPPYSDDEKAFLKATWRNEYHFLLQHGLKIYKDKDRAEGRCILRAMMRRDDSDKDYFERQSLDGENLDESEDDEFDLEGHQADYNFSHKQLDCVEKYHGNSGNFIVYGQLLHTLMMLKKRRQL